MALDAVRREEPHWTHPDLEDLYRPPRHAHPVFYGAFDWHSAVHGHWSLVRLLSLPNQADDNEVVAHLTGTIQRRPILREVATLASGVLDRFEIPYGLAWVLMLEHELSISRLVGIRSLKGEVKPLADLARKRLKGWLDELHEPSEVGTHANTAFALGLLRDSSSSLWTEVSDRVVELWADRSNRSLAIEVGEHDFVSPTLEAIDVLVSAAPDRVVALALANRMLPDAPDQILSLEPVVCPDPADGKASHLLGLNLSRARALAAIASHLPPGELSAACDRAAHNHLEFGLDALTHDHFATTHWVGSFALRALTS